MMYHRPAPVTSWKPTTLGPNFWTASTAKCGSGRWKTATPPWCRLGASVAMTMYPADERVYMPSVHLVSWKMCRAFLDWAILHSANYSLPLRPFRML